MNFMTGAGVRLPLTNTVISLNDIFYYRRKYNYSLFYLFYYDL